MKAYSRVGMALAAALVCLPLAAGCEQHGGEGGGGKVAIVDVKRVAVETGITQAGEAAFKSRMDGHDADINRMKAAFNAQLNMAAGAAATQPAESRPNVDEMRSRMTDQINQRVMMRNMDLEQMDKDLSAKFRQDIAPVAKRVAAQRGMTVVIVKDDRVLSYEDAADITPDVILEIQRSATGTGSFRGAPGAPGTPGAPGSQAPIPAPGGAAPGGAAPGPQAPSAIPAPKPAPAPGAPTPPGR